VDNFHNAEGSPQDAMVAVDTVIDVKKVFDRHLGVFPLAWKCVGGGGKRQARARSRAPSGYGA